MSKSMTLPKVSQTDVSKMTPAELNNFIKEKEPFYTDYKQKCLKTNGENDCMASNTLEIDIKNAKCRLNQLTYDELVKERDHTQKKIRDYNDDFNGMTFENDEEKKYAIESKEKIMNIYEKELNEIEEKLKDKDKEASLCKAAKGGKRSRKSKKRSRKMKKKSRKYKRSKKNRK